jgi:hypothetical protein
MGSNFCKLFEMLRVKKSWSQEDYDRLKTLVASGASPLRVSLALKRSVAVTKNKARELGIPFRTEGEMKRERRRLLNEKAPG